MEDEDQGDLGLFEKAKAEARTMYEGMGLRKLTEAMQEQRTKKDDLENQLKVVNAHYDVLRMEKIPERMELDGVDKITYEGIGRVSVTADMLVSVKAGCKQELYQWLEDHGFGSLIQPVINASTLKAFVKGRVKKGEEFPQEYLNSTPILRASITKA